MPATAETPHIPDRAVGADDAVCIVDACTFVNRLAPQFEVLRLVVRMHSLEIYRSRRFGDFWVKTENGKHFLRPNGFARIRPPGPASGMTDLLRFLQVGILAA